MKRSSKLRLLLPEGATAALAEPSAGDELQLRCERTGTYLPRQPILGYARTPDGLCYYLPGSTASQLRTSLEFGLGFAEETWFGPVPATLTEIMVDEYAYGHLLLYPINKQEALPRLRVA